MLPAHTTGRAAALTGLGIALFVPLFMGILPAAGLDQGGFTDAAALDDFVRQHFAVFALPYLNGLWLHLTGLVVVLGIHRRLAERSPWVLAATAGGFAWMALDIAQNGVGLYAAREIVGHATAEVSGPQLVLLGQLTTGLRLAGHVLGGLWVLVASAVALRHGGLARGASWLGVVAGILMSVNVIVPPSQMPLFLVLPIWFAWIAVSLLRESPVTVDREPASVVV